MKSNTLASIGGHVKKFALIYFVACSLVFIISVLWVKSQPLGMTNNTDFHENFECRLYDEGDSFIEVIRNKTDKPTK